MRAERRTAVTIALLLLVGGVLLLREHLGLWQVRTT